jgi:hypothetical protein
VTTPFGNAFQVQPRSVVSTLIVDPTIGFDVSRSALNLPNGATPNSENFLLREGRLEPRPMLSKLTDNTNSANPIGAPVMGGTEVVDVAGNRYLLLSYANTGGQLAWLAGLASAWQTAGYVANSVNNSPANGVDYKDYWDWTQIFFDRADENIAVGARYDRKPLYAWPAGSATFSTLTGAPGARTVCAFDNYLLAANVEEAGEIFIQRVRWSDRGSASSWTGGLSGFEDLLAARGGVNRIIPLESRVAVFFDDEVWIGTPVEFPGTFRFAPLDTSIGCPYPWTATNTSLGIIFMARNFQMYLLPREGGPPQAIGQKLHRSIRDAIQQSQRAFGVYDGVRNLYQFYYSSGGSGNVPHRAAFLDLASGAWAPQSFSSTQMQLTRGFTASLPTSRGSTWDEMTQAWDSESRTWDDFLGLGNERQQVVLGSSAGTVYGLSSTATRDDGLAVPSYWETDLLGEEWPGQQKTALGVAVDYVSPSASSLTVRMLQGQAFATGTRVSLDTASQISQAYAYPYTPSRYAALRVESEDQRAALHRFHVTLRVGGR